MSTPSLLNVPYRLKAGTLYSQIPETGLGDFVVTRSASNVATRINSLGFIETVADNVPRLDYPLGGAVNGCPALLVEPSAQNLCLQSQTLDVSATWVPESGTLVSPNSTATLSPDGLNTAEIVTLVSGGANQLYQAIAMASGTTYTASIFLKNIALTSGQTFFFSTANQDATINQVNCTIDLANATITSAVVGVGVTVSNVALDNYGNGWYRARFTFSFAVGNAAARLRLRQNSSVGYNTAFYVWGAQFETGSVATSYIRTTTQAITRGADVIRKTSITSLIGQSEGAVYFEVEVTDEARNKWFCTLDSASNSFIQMWVNPTRQINAQINNSGTIVVSPLASSVLAIGYHKVAFAYNTATNGCIMYVDGVQNPATTRTVGSPGLPAFNDMRFGGYIAGTTESIKGHVRAGAVYPNRLSNSELAALTTP